MAVFICWDAEDEDPGNVSTGIHVVHEVYADSAAEEYAEKRYRGDDHFDSLAVRVRTEQGNVYTYDVEVESRPHFSARHQ